MKRDLIDLHDLTTEELTAVLEDAARCKRLRGDPGRPRPLAEGCYGLIFSKASTRTRVSFEVGIRELGGSSIFLSASEMQLGRGESEVDTARVLSRYLHGVIIRTHEHEGLIRFARAATVPVINGLSDTFHPCQVIADLFTLKERFGRVDGLRIAFVGDGACNLANSWILATARLPIELRVVCPEGYEPAAGILARGGEGRVRVVRDPVEGVRGADVVYTDVWVSMGFEEERERRLRALEPYRVDAALLEQAGPEAIVMHCLPAHPGEEITREVLESPQSVVWDQAENRLHAQKAIMEHLFARA